MICVKLYLDFQHDVAKKMAMRQVEQLVERSEFYTVDEILSPHVAFLADIYFDQRKSNQYYQDTTFPNYRTILAHWADNLQSKEFDTMQEIDEKLEIDEFHRLISTRSGAIINNNQPPADDDISKCYYSQLISIIVNDTNRLHQIKLSNLLL